jgi:protoporphyrinogen/coproporphyrinogen III oxidase
MVSVSWNCYNSRAVRPGESPSEGKMRQRRVVIIGAGMAGLAAAHRLASSPSIDIQVLEKAALPGGRVFTEEVAGIPTDTGAQVLANFYTYTLRLIHHYGLANDLIRISRSNAIVRGGQLYELHTDPRVLFTPLISTKSKLVLLKTLRPLVLHWRQLDAHMFASAAPLDVRSLKDYAREALGQEVLDYLINPPLNGIFYYTPEHTSQALLFLLLKAAIALKLYTLEGGLQRLPQAMAANLPISYGVDVTSVSHSSAGGYVLHTLCGGQEQKIVADGVICAVPASSITTLIPDLDSEQQTFFNSIHYSSTVALSVGLSNSIGGDLYGFFSGPSETRYVGAVTIESGKRSHPHPTGHDVIALFSSAFASRDLLDQSDQTIYDRLWTDLARTGFTPPPVHAQLTYRVRRWPLAIPMFDVGHFLRLQMFMQGKIETGAIVYAGDYLGGPFIEGAVTTGYDAANRLLSHLDPH